MLVEELIVIFACLNNVGCTETSNQYFTVHPEVKTYIDREAKQAREYIGPKLVDTVGPVLFVIGGGTGIIHVQEHINLQMTRDSGKLVFSWSF